MKQFNFEQFEHLRMSARWCKCDATMGLAHAPSVEICLLMHLVSAELLRVVAFQMLLDQRLESTVVADHLMQCERRTGGTEEETEEEAAVAVTPRTARTLTCAGAWFVAATAMAAA